MCPLISKGRGGGGCYQKFSYSENPTKYPFYINVFKCIIFNVGIMLQFCNKDRFWLSNSCVGEVGVGEVGGDVGGGGWGGGARICSNLTYVIISYMGITNVKTLTKKTTICVS